MAWDRRFRLAVCEFILTELKKKSSTGRLAFLDWVRGLAAVIMLQGHAFHAFTKPELRESGPFRLSQFAGGLPPALFLFLVGVTLAFLMDSRERAGASPLRRVLSSTRRAGYLFALAFAFRLTTYVLGFPSSPASELLRVDILNAMGFAIAVFSLLAIFRTADRVRFAAILGIAIAAVSPVVATLDWTAIPGPIRHYLVPDYLYFGFFPWASFVAFGLSAGSIIRSLAPEQMERAAQWSALLGLGLILTSQYFSNLPYSFYPQSEFWLDSPWLIASKLGVIFLILPFAYLWTRHSGRRWSWVRQFGTTSLLVYWVHIELMYGRWLWFVKENLTISQTAAIAVAFILLMLALSVARTQWKNWRTLGMGLGWYFFLRRAPASVRTLPPAPDQISEAA